MLLASMFLVCFSFLLLIHVNLCFLSYWLIVHKIYLAIRSFVINSVQYWAKSTVVGWLVCGNILYQWVAFNKFYLFLHFSSLPINKKQKSTRMKTCSRILSPLWERPNCQSTFQGVYFSFKLGFFNLWARRKNPRGSYCINTPNT